MGLLDKGKDAAKRAGDAAQKGVAEAREKAHEMSLKRRLSALAEDLGQVVFRQRQGEAGLDAEVDRLVSEMRAVDAEIEAARGGLECHEGGPPRCHAPACHRRSEREEAHSHDCCMPDWISAAGGWTTACSMSGASAWRSAQRPRRSRAWRRLPARPTASTPGCWLSQRSCQGGVGSRRRACACPPVARDCAPEPSIGL